MDGGADAVYVLNLVKLFKLLPFRCPKWLAYCQAKLKLVCIHSSNTSLSSYLQAPTYLFLLITIGDGLIVVIPIAKQQQLKFINELFQAPMSSANISA